jgi:hypothetical protein
MTRGTREKESASWELEEPDIAEGRLTDRAEANHVALIRLAKWFANVLLRFLRQSECLSRTDRSPFTKLATRGRELSGERPALTVHLTTGTLLRQLGTLYSLQIYFMCR